MKATSIRFATPLSSKITINTIPRASDKNKAWYQKKDIIKFKNEAQIDGQLHSNRLFFDSTVSLSQKNRSEEPPNSVLDTHTVTQETDFCSIGLELRCSFERQKMKYVAIKGILEAQRLLLRKGYSHNSTHFMSSMAQLSSLLTRSAKYIAIHDAMVSDSPTFTSLSLRFLSSTSQGEIDDENKLVQFNNVSKRRRIV